MIKKKPAAASNLGSIQNGADKNNADANVPTLPPKQSSLVFEPQTAATNIKSVGASVAGPSPKPQNAVIEEPKSASATVSEIPELGKNNSSDSKNGSNNTSDLAGGRRLSKSLIPIPSGSQISLNEPKGPPTDVIVKRIERDPNSRRTKEKPDPSKRGNTSGPSIQRMEKRSQMAQQGGVVKVVTVNDGNGGGTGAMQKQANRNGANRVQFDMDGDGKSGNGKVLAGEKPTSILRKSSDTGQSFTNIAEDAIPPEVVPGTGDTSKAKEAVVVTDKSKPGDHGPASDATGPTNPPSAGPENPAKSQTAVSKQSAQIPPAKSPQAAEPKPGDSQAKQAEKAPSLQKGALKSGSTDSLTSKNGKVVKVLKKKLIPIDGPDAAITDSSTKPAKSANPKPPKPDATTKPPTAVAGTKGNASAAVKPGAKPTGTAKPETGKPVDTKKESPQGPTTPKSSAKSRSNSVPPAKTDTKPSKPASEANPKPDPKEPKANTAARQKSKSEPIKSNAAAKQNDKAAALPSKVVDNSKSKIPSAQASSAKKAEGSTSKTSEKSKTPNSKPKDSKETEVVVPEAVPAAVNVTEPTATAAESGTETKAQRSFRLRSRLKMGVDGCFAMGLSEPSDEGSSPALTESGSVKTEIPVRKPEPPPPDMAAPKPVASVSATVPLKRHPSARRSVIKTLGLPATGWSIENFNREEVQERTRVYKFRRARSLEDVSQMYALYRKRHPLAFGHHDNYNEAYLLAGQMGNKDEMFRKYSADDHNYNPRYDEVSAEGFGFENPALEAERADLRSPATLPPIRKSNASSLTAKSQPVLSETSVRYLQQHIDRTKKQGVQVTLPRSRSRTRNPTPPVLDANGYVPRRPAPHPLLVKHVASGSNRPITRGEAAAMQAAVPPRQQESARYNVARVHDTTRYSDRIQKRKELYPLDIADGEDNERGRSRHRNPPSQDATADILALQEQIRSLERAAIASKDFSQQRQLAAPFDSTYGFSQNTVRPDPEPSVSDASEPRYRPLKTKKVQSRKVPIMTQKQPKMKGKPLKKLEIDAPETQNPMNPGLSFQYLQQTLGGPQWWSQQQQMNQLPPNQQLLPPLPPYLQQQQQQLQMQQFQQNPFQYPQQSLQGQQQSQSMPVFIPSANPSVPPSLMPARIRIQNVPVMVMQQAMVIEPTGEPAGSLGAHGSSEANAGTTAFIDAGMSGLSAGALSMPYYGNGFGLGAGSTEAGVGGPAFDPMNMNGMPYTGGYDPYNFNGGQYRGGFGFPNAVFPKANAGAKEVPVIGGKKTGVRSMIKKGIIGRHKVG
ncbi:hypothetical protein BJ741DRAFT_708200 [Chytriomyces cf. hyalinus JEL632]|nr:hypothetical protein BJ741DRAFT_708200 [Chytriomyces cf. hyalinus JEL632]